MLSPSLIELVTSLFTFSSLQCRQSTLSDESLVLLYPSLESLSDVISRVLRIELEYMERHLKQIIEAKSYTQIREITPKHECVVFRDSLAG